MTACVIAGSTATPDADNTWTGDDVPASAAVLDLAAYSVQPARDAAPFMWGWVASAIAPGDCIDPQPTSSRPGDDGVGSPDLPLLPEGKLARSWRS
jgi:hypothetical protein